MSLRHCLIVVLCFTAACLATPPAAAQQPAFLSVIEDLPLMPGFVENESGALKFETEAGRIAEVSASGAGTASAVADYYSRALPQLGWVQETVTQYRRDDEVLTLEMFELDQNGAGVEVHFTLSPAEKK